MADVEILHIETPGLGDRSYVATDGEVAVVVDPQRDIDRVLALVEPRRLRVTHVLETHVHNDYVTGGLQLARDCGAAYVVAAEEQLDFDRSPIVDGDVVETGALRLRALATPGHTHHHLSYLLEHDGIPHAVFTGGSMLYGATGRTDLAGREHSRALAVAQFHSVRRLAAELAGDVEVLPTHGFGSFCSATPTSGESSDIAEQSRVNPALTAADETSFVESLLAGLGAYPAYYARMAPINRRGPAPLTLAPPVRARPHEVAERIAAGEWVVDLRSRRAFAAGHLPGSLSFELANQFVSYLGWLIPWGTPLTLLGESPHQVERAQRELVRIGIDRLAGAAVGEPTDWADGQGLRSYRVARFAELVETQRVRPVHVLDVRRHDERAASHVAGSLHVPLHELAERLDEVPDGEVWVHCASGYRAAVACSLLDRQAGARDRSLVLVDGDYTPNHPPPRDYAVVN